MKNDLTFFAFAPFTNHAGRIAYFLDFQTCALNVFLPPTRGTISDCDSSEHQNLFTIKATARCLTNETYKRFRKLGPRLGRVPMFFPSSKAVRFIEL